MTVLPSKQSRDNLNIDIHERAIVYSALLLRSALTDSANPNNFSDNILLTIDETSEKILIEGSLFYNRQSGFESALDIPGNVIEFTAFDAGNLTIDPCISSGTYLTDVDRINTLERYFCFHSFRLIQRLIEVNNTNAKNYVSIKIIDKVKSGNPYIKISLNLPFNYLAYLSSFNILRSVTKLVNPFIEPIPGINNSYLGNDSYLDNDFYLNNGA